MRRGKSPPRSAAKANAVHWVGMGEDKEYIHSVEYVRKRLGI